MANFNPTISRCFGYGRLPAVGVMSNRGDLAKHLGVAEINLFCDRFTSSRRWTSQAFIKLLGNLRSGDLVVLPALADLGDRPEEIVERIGLLNDRGVIVRILKENIDCGRPRGRFALRALLALVPVEPPAAAANLNTVHVGRAGRGPYPLQSRLTSSR